MPLNQPLNQILYGPPGTGKTYRTRREAVKIIDGKEYKDDDALKKRYEELSAVGRIVFTTFHQSLGYEEFVEGIKPKIQKAPISLGANKHPIQEARGQIQYEIQDGIFKTIAKSTEKASQNILSIPHNELVWRISLGYGGEFKQECFKKNRIAVGWDIGDLRDREVYEKHKKEKTLSQLYNFYDNIKKGDLFFVYQNSGRRQARAAAVGIIKGNYEYDTEPKIDKKLSKYTKKIEEYKSTREVEWLWFQSNENEYIDVYDINNETELPQRTCHETNINASALLKRTQEKLTNEGPRKYVLIIDEINRGNISKILGELITLIEDNKRLGNEEAMKVKLPYSGDDFGVPNNLHLIGTMNTADRSIAFLDTALRRRFSFIEMMPDYGVLAKELKPIAGINIPQMLKAMNEQIIEQHDRDHQIGHSYFLRLKKSPDRKIEVLADIFKHEIIPLLREYFYNDAKQIEKVLNGNKFLNEGDDLDKALQEAAHYQAIYKNPHNS